MRFKRSGVTEDILLTRSNIGGHLGDRHASNLFGLDSEPRKLASSRGTDTWGAWGGSAGTDTWGKARRQTLGANRGDRHLGQSAGTGNWGTATRRTFSDLIPKTDTWGQTHEQHAHEELGQSRVEPFASVQILEFSCFLLICPWKLLQCEKTIVQSGTMSRSCRWDSVAFFVAATLVNDAEGGWPIEIGIPSWRGALASILLTQMPFKWFMYGTVVYAE